MLVSLMIIASVNNNFLFMTLNFFYIYACACHVNMRCTRTDMDLKRILSRIYALCRYADIDADTEIGQDVPGKKKCGESRYCAFSDAFKTIKTRI